MQHLVLPCHWTQRSTIVADMIKSHGCAGRSIVFTDTKKDANELTASLSENCGAMALHGDIPQVGTPYKSAHFHKILHFFPTNSQASQKCSCSQITKFVQCCLKVFADVFEAQCADSKCSGNLASSQQCHMTAVHAQGAVCSAT